MRNRTERPIAELVAHYRRLRPAIRAGLWALLAFELSLIIDAERDIQRQPPESIRGPKPLWRVLATQNLVGPAAYFGFGRRRTR